MIVTNVKTNSAGAILTEGVNLLVGEKAYALADAVAAVTAGNASQRVPTPPTPILLTVTDSEINGTVTALREAHCDRLILTDSDNKPMAFRPTGCGKTNYLSKVEQSDALTARLMVFLRLAKEDAANGDTRPIVITALYYALPPESTLASVAKTLSDCGRQSIIALADERAVSAFAVCRPNTVWLD